MVEVLFDLSFNQFLIYFNMSVMHELLSSKKKQICLFKEQNV